MVPRVKWLVTTVLQVDGVLLCRIQLRMAKPGERQARLPTQLMILVFPVVFLVMTMTSSNPPTWRDLLRRW